MSATTPPHRIHSGKTRSAPQMDVDVDPYAMGWVFACVHRVWVLHTLSGVGPPWKQEERTAKEPKTIIIVVYTHARTHARTHTWTPARTHARTHARTNARTHCSRRDSEFYDWRLQYPVCDDASLFVRLFVLGLTGL